MGATPESLANHSVQLRDYVTKRDRSASESMWYQCTSLFLSGIHDSWMVWN